MTHILIRLALAATLLGVAPAGAAEDRPAGTLATLREAASEQVRPDLLLLSLRLETRGGGVQEVQASLNQAMAAALALAKAHGDIRVTTGAYTVHEAWLPQEGGKQRREWRAAQGLGLGGSDFGRITELAGRLQAEGFTLADTRFDLTPDLRGAVEARLTRAAIARLSKSAAEVADALGLSPARWRTVTVTKEGGAPDPRLAMAPRAMTATAAPPQIEAADRVVTVTVEAEVELR